MNSAVQRLQRYPDLVARALAFATEVHAGQQRDGGAPYIGHPVAVALLLADCGYEHPDLLAAALLHDVCEDCGVSGAELAGRFGAEVARVVQLLSKGEAGYLGRVFADRSASLIKAADRLHNVRSLVTAPTAKRVRYSRETLAALLPHLEASARQFGQDAPFLRLAASELRERCQRYLETEGGLPGD